MPQGNNGRRKVRLNHRATVRITCESESIEGNTRNLSDSGLYIVGFFNKTITVGDILDVLALDIENALSKQVVIRRIEPGEGFAVEFILPPDIEG